MERFFYVAAGISGFIAAAMGAFGVHGLKSRISPELFGMFETAVRYQMFHALALFAAAWGWARWRHRAIGAAGVLFILGMVFFNPSLRTRASFEAAMLRSGGHAIVLEVGAGVWTLEHRDGVVMDENRTEHIREAVPVLSRYVDALDINEDARHAIFEGNARRVYPRLDARLKARGL